MSATEQDRPITLRLATLMGVGAIVGGGVLALAGSAFAMTGPSAVLAFAVNGVLALLTAASFAEMATAFPESGGTYAFARRVLSLRAAFVVGWLLWFAYIVAGLLYALGFGAFGAAAVGALIPSMAGGSARIGLGLAIVSVLGYTLLLARRPGGGGVAETIGKLVVFGIVIVVGLALLPLRVMSGDVGEVTPFFAGGMGGFVGALGLTFIALQGFDAIAAVAGEVKDPVRTLPRAMGGSLVIALVVYVPLLIVVTTVGVSGGESVVALAKAAPETLVAVAAERFMGRAGWWLIVIAALLAMASALAANVVAASRIAASMAADRTLPGALGAIDPATGAPRAAVLASGLAMGTLLLVVQDVTTAGAAASLIFLISFLLAHVTALLARRRGGGGRPDAFRTPLFPLVPVLGIVGCGVLALYQLATQPAGAGMIAAWMGLGALLYTTFLKDRAAVVDARVEAFDPELARLRGRSPLVLAPLANPAHAHALVGVARAVASPQVGRVLLLSILRDGGEEHERASDLVRIAARDLVSAGGSSRVPELLFTVAPEPWKEIERVARAHACESLVLGLSDLADPARQRALEALLAAVDCDVVVLRAPTGWALSDVRRVLIPTGGRGGHDTLRARLLGALERTVAPSVLFVQAVSERATDSQLAESTARLRRFALEEYPRNSEVEVVRSADPAEAVLERARAADLVVLGLSPGRDGATLGGLSLRLARETDTATLLIGRKGWSGSGR